MTTTLEYAVKVKRETAKALLLDMAHATNEFWAPKSQAKKVGTYKCGLSGNYYDVYSLPFWLAKKEGIVARALGENEWDLSTPEGIFNGMCV